MCIRDSASIFRRGDPGDSMMIVLSGRVRISNAVPGGKEAIINFIDPGRLFGEIALLDGKPRSADATADTRSELLVLHRRELLPFLQAHPAVTIRLVALLCERLRRVTAMMEDVMFLNTGQRIAKALLRLAEEHGTRLADGMTIDVKINQTDLGFHVGVCREGVNRQLRQWQRAGIIGREEGRITIRQPTRLRSLTLSGA